jgi:hypothetical protein
MKRILQSVALMSSVSLVALCVTWTSYTRTAPPKVNATEPTTESVSSATAIQEGNTTTELPPLFLLGSKSAAVFTPADSQQSITPSVSLPTNSTLDLSDVQTHRSQGVQRPAQAMQQAVEAKPK